MPITGHPAAVRDPRRRVAREHGRRPRASSRASTSGRRRPPGDARARDARDRLSDRRAAIPHAIELLVGLLLSPSFVAIVARPLRLPYTVALVIAGLLVGHRRECGRAPDDRRLARARPARPPARPRLRGRLPAPDRRASSLVRRARPARCSRASSSRRPSSRSSSTSRPGCGLDLAFIVGAMLSATDPAAVVATFKRLRVPHALATIVDGESLLNDGTGLVLFAIAVAAVYAPVESGRGRRVRSPGTRRRSASRSASRPGSWRPGSWLWPTTTSSS